MKTENLSTLKIHKLSKEQYDRELAAGRIDETALYLTPDQSADMSQFVTVDQLDEAIAAIPTPDVSGQISAHDSDTNAHADIRQFVTDSIAQIPTPDVSGQINAHNTNQESHADIRASIDSLSSEKANKSDVDALLQELNELKASVVTVYSGTEATMTQDVGSDGDVYLVTE